MLNRYIENDNPNTFKARYTKEHIKKLNNLLLNPVELENKIKLTENNFAVICDIEMEQFEILCEELEEYFEPRQVFMFFKITDFYVIYKTFGELEFYLKKLKNENEQEHIIFLFFLEMLIKFHLKFLQYAHAEKVISTAKNKYSEKIGKLKAEFFEFFGEEF